MKQRGGVYNQLAPRRKNSPKLNKALLIINSVLFVCSLVVGVLYIHHGEPRSSISMFLISVVTIFNAWAAMLALPFTILTNALSGGHMGTYLGLFNGTICIPQIIAAALGGTILALFTPQGGLPPEINMLVLAGIMLIIGAACVYLIKENQGEKSK